MWAKIINEEGDRRREGSENDIWGRKDKKSGKEEEREREKDKGRGSERG